MKFKSHSPSKLGNTTCPGSYSDGVDVRYGRRSVTGKCTHCGRRVVYVTLHADGKGARGLACHAAPAK